MIDATPKELEIVDAILSTRVPGYEVRAFGSRARWEAKDHSDLDLVIRGESELDRGTIADLKDAFAESDLRFRVDVVDWHAVSDAFRDAIEVESVMIREGKNEEWREMTLGDIADFTISNVDKKTKPSETPVRLCNYTDVYYNQYIRSDMDFMDATATDREISRCSLFEGDVVITKDSEKDDDIGVPAYVAENIDDLVCGYHLVILRPKPDKVDGAYLFYSLNAREAQHQFHARANGVTRFGLRKADIGTVTVPVPPLPEQRRIAHILGTLDDKIELNRRMNETLEEMARAVFKDWFVDFGPVRAKMEGREAYLPEEVWGLFPDRFVESELEEVPEGWGLRRLGDFGEVVTGKTPSTRNPRLYGDEIPFLKIPDMHGKMFVVDTSTKLSHEGASTQPKKTLPPGSVSVSCIATPGLVVLNHTDVQTNQQINSVIPYDGFSSNYLYWACRQLATDVMLGGSGGSVYSNMKKSTFSDLRTIDVDGTVSQAFDLMVSQLHGTILRNEMQTRLLSQIRDALLPVLVSGEVGIQDIDKVVKHE